MNFFAIIPARKGSKRLPGKNSKTLGGKPLVQWTIECAIAAGVFKEVIVSTDDPFIAKLAKEKNCLVPGLRDSNLSSDQSDLVSVCLNAAQHAHITDPSDIIVLLQPTSPFRKPATITNAIAALKEKSSIESVVSFSPCEIRPEWIHTVNKDGYIQPLGDSSSMLKQRSEGVYLLPNGLIYVISLGNLKKYHNFFTPLTTPLVIEDAIESHDIDDQDDWDKAVAILENNSLYPDQYKKTTFIDH